MNGYNSMNMSNNTNPNNRKVHRTVKVVKKKQSPALSAFATFVTVFIVILFMIASFFAGYYAGSNKEFDIKLPSFDFNFLKNKTSKKEDPTSKEAKVIEYNLNDTKVSNLIINLTKGVGTDCWAIEEFAKDKKVYAADITNQRAYTIAEANYFYSSGKSVISAEEYTSEVKKYLGSEYRFEPVLVEYNNATCPQYEYHADKKEFVRHPNECNTICQGNRTVFKMVKAKDTDGILEVHAKVLFAAKDGGAYYSDYARTNFITDNTSDLNVQISNGSTYKFVFKNENDKYVFVSSELVEE